VPPAGQSLNHDVWDVGSHVTTQCGDFADQCAGYVRPRGGGGQDHGLDPGEALVHPGHADLEVEVGRATGSLDDRAGVVTGAERHQQAVERLGRDPVEAGDRRSYEL